LSKRFPEQHEIDEKAGRLFENSLPTSWVCRPQLKDYGIDREIEIFDAGKSTGIIFKAQIKGTKKLNINIDKSIISISLRTDEVGYLCEELKIPTVLILVDVSSSTIWWHAIQLDSKLRTRLLGARQNGQLDIVIHISANNKLPDSVNSLLAKINESEVFLSARSISIASPNTFLNLMDSVQNFDQLISGLGRSLAVVRIHKLNKLWQEGDISSAQSLIEEIKGDKKSSVEERFEACIIESKLSILEARRSGRQNDYCSIEHKYSIKLRDICKGGPLHLRAYAALSVKAAELHKYARNDLYIFMNSLIHRDPRNIDIIEPLWSMMLPAARRNAAILVVRKYRQCHRLLRFMFSHEQFSVMPLGIELVIGNMLTFLLRLRTERMTDAAKVYELSLRNLAEHAIKISVAFRNWQEVSVIILNSALLCNFRDEISVKFYKAWIDKQVQQIQDVDIKGSVVEQANRQFEKMKEEVSEKDENEDLEISRQIYIGMAESMGIDLSDSGDKIAEIVRIGLRDIDPTRVLKDCRYLYLAIGTGGVPARMLLLPTAGFKTLFCTLHNHGIGSMSLDNACESLKEDYCSKCKNRSPHPSDWKWSHSWQYEQDKIYKNKFRPL